MNGNLALVEQSPDMKTQRLEQFKEADQLVERAKQLTVHDEHSAALAAVVQTEMRDMVDRLNQLRTAEVRPLIDAKASIDNDYKVYTDDDRGLFPTIDTRLDRLVKEYRAEVRRKEQEAQRKAIEEANRKRAEEEAKAAELRRQAEEIQRQMEASPVTKTRDVLQAELSELKDQRAIARATGDEDALLVIEGQEQQVLGRIAALSSDVSAIELEAQAQQAELAAATIAPEVVERQVAKSMSLPTGRSMSYTLVMRPLAFTNGLPLDTKFRRDDPRFRFLPDKLFDFNLKRLERLIKDGETFDGVETVEDEVSRRGRKR